MKQPRDHAIGLMRKATHDLLAADAILSAGIAFDMVCFHAQQAVEKSLKALLTNQNIDYPRKHDLDELLGSVRRVAPDIDRFAAQISLLTPYAVDARYVDDLQPEFAVAAKALEDADEVFRFAITFMGLENEVAADWFLRANDEETGGSTA